MALVGIIQGDSITLLGIWEASQRTLLQFHLSGTLFWSRGSNPRLLFNRWLLVLASMCLCLDISLRAWSTSCEWES